MPTTPIKVSELIGTGINAESLGGERFDRYVLWSDFNTEIAAYYTKTQADAHFYPRTEANTQFYSRAQADERFLRRNANSVPTQNNSFNLGSTSAQWANVYATNFHGTATTAKYADLAERYTCVTDLPVGTVVRVGQTPHFEVEECLNELDPAVVGVVSAAPAYLMNSECDGPAVALAGKVLVRVVGPVTKGDFIVPAGRGLAKAGRVTSGELPFKMGISLESNASDGEKLVECIIK
jgi:hypothetical protein